MALTLAAAYRAGQTRSASATLNHTLELETHVVLAPDLRHRVDALIRLALWCAQADSIRGRHVIAQVIAQADRLGEPDLRAKARYAAAVGEVLIRAPQEQAAQSYRELVRLSTEFSQLGDSVSAAWCDLFAGVALEQRGDPGGAVVLVDSALMVFRRYGDVEGEARCFNTFGMQQSLSRRYIEAIRLHRRAQSLAAETENPATHAVSWLNLVEANTESALEAMETGERSEAQQLWEEAYEEYPSVYRYLATLGHRRLLPRLSGLYALALVHLGYETEARAEIERALALAASLGEHYVLGSARLHAAMVHLAMREYAESYALLVAVVSECEPWMRPVDLVRTYRGLMTAAEHLGNVKAALAYSKRVLDSELVWHEHAVQRRRHMAKTGLEPREIEDMPADSVEELMRLNEELEAERQKWEHLARTDPVTNLANRGHFDEHLTRIVARTSAAKQSLSMLLVDIDHFKSINDTFGHPAGDEVLRRIAKAIRSACRRGDVAARVGGEEFALILPGVSLQGAIALGERLRQAISDVDVTDVCPNRTVTVSVGVVGFDLICTPERAYAAADEALYLAKQRGRNRVCVGMP